MTQENNSKSLCFPFKGSEFETLVRVVGGTIVIYKWCSLISRQNIPRNHQRRIHQSPSRHFKWLAPNRFLAEVEKTKFRITREPPRLSLVMQTQILVLSRPPERSFQQRFQRSPLPPHLDKKTSLLCQMCQKSSTNMSALSAGMAAG
ncbi:uncharacterized protein ACB058_003056 isoform 1-T1 [Synchiropus picturatus]